jgi:hypothetical protein
LLLFVQLHNVQMRHILWHVRVMDFAKLIVLEWVSAVPAAAINVTASATVNLNKAANQGDLTQVTAEARPETVPNAGSVIAAGNG